MISYDEQMIRLDGVQNARQLGGYIGAGGKKVKNNVIFRTGTLFGASREACDRLSKKYRVSDIIDFRMEHEAAVMPDPDIEGARYHNISVLNELPITKEDFILYKKCMGIDDTALRYNTMYESGISVDSAEIYKSIVFSDDGKAGYKRFFDILLNKPENSAVLFHCTQGKDRTGVAALLLLSALGVDRETVTADYLLTNISCKPLLDKIRSDMKNAKLSKEAGEFALFIESVDRSFIDPVFTMMDEEYGSVDGYLQKALGLSEADIDRLNEMYLE